VGVIEQVRPLIMGILADLGLDLYDLEHAGGVVKVTIDRPGGVDLEAIADVTRMVSRELDHLELPLVSYTLEVSSPGLERALRTPDHFRRAVGSVVNLRTHPDVEGERRVQGRLADADDEGVSVAPDGGAEGERRLRYDEIERARTVFEWGPATRPAPARQRSGATTRKATR